MCADHCFGGTMEQICTCAYTKAVYISTTGILRHAHIFHLTTRQPCQKFKDLVLFFKMDSGEKRTQKECLSLTKINLKDNFWSLAQQNFSLDSKGLKTSGMRVFLNMFTIRELFTSFIVVENWSSGRGLKWNKILSFIVRKDVLF